MVFIIKPISAQLTEDHDLIGKSDPYCIIHIGGQKFQTKPDNGAGLKPKWNETFTFQGSATELKIQVYDEDVGKDDYYGQGVLKLNKWLSNPSKIQTDVIEIFLKEKKTGQVLINIEYQGGAINSNQPNQWGNVAKQAPSQGNQGSQGGYNNPANLGY